MFEITDEKTAKVIMSVEKIGRAVTKKRWRGDLWEAQDSTWKKYRLQVHAEVHLNGVCTIALGGSRTYSILV